MKERMLNASANQFGTVASLEDWEDYWNRWREKHVRCPDFHRPKSTIQARIMTPKQMAAVLRILRIVCKRFGVTVAELESSGREWRLVWPRWIAIWLVRRETGLDSTKLGSIFNRHRRAIDHAIHGVATETDSNNARAMEVVAVLVQYWREQDVKRTWRSLR